MTAHRIVEAYLALGGVAAVAVLAGRTALPTRERVPLALLAVGLWPFLLPTLLPGEAVVRPALPSPEGGYGPRLDALACQLQDGWARAGAAATAERERRRVEGFLQRLRASAARLAELEAALPSAPERVRLKLGELRARTANELEQGLGLLEELLAQLTLLRFVGLGEDHGATAERDHVEELLARIESLAELNRPEA
jgi:hypothetical protein